MEIESKLRDPLVDRLFEAILLLESKEECYCFFEDLCTVGEVNALAQRLEVAKMLDANITYALIGEQTGVSTATISRVKRFLQYGAGGYRLILRRLAEREREGQIPVVDSGGNETDGGR